MRNSGRVAFYDNGLWSGEILEVDMPSVDAYVERGTNGSGEGGGYDILRAKVKVGVLAASNPEVNAGINADDTKTVLVERIIGDERNFGAIYAMPAGDRTSKVMRLLSRYTNFKNEVFVEGIVEVVNIYPDTGPLKPRREKIGPELVLVQEDDDGISRIAFLGE